MSKLITISDPNASFEQVFTKDERQVEELGQLLQHLVREKNQVRVEVNELKDAMTKVISKIDYFDNAIKLLDSEICKALDKIDDLNKNNKEKI
jgi:regulator of replication initiation timing